MVNYEVDPSLVAALVPRGTELDRWSGHCYVSIVAFEFLNTRLRGIPIPFYSNFSEVNLRFYVRREAGSELRRGVVFVREIVPRRAIALVARLGYNERYIRLPMRHRITAGESEIALEYAWKCKGAWCRISAEARGTPELPPPGSEQQFISEHYWGYSTARGMGTIEYRVEHPSWRVWNCTRAQFAGDVAALYGAALAAALARPPDSAFIAEGSPVTVYAGRPLGLK